MKNASERVENSVEENSINARMIVKIFEVPHVVHSAGRVGMQGLRTVPRDLEPVRFGEGRYPQPLGNARAPRDVGL